MTRHHRLSASKMCHCFGVLGEAVFLAMSNLRKHCFSEDSEAVALGAVNPLEVRLFRKPDFCFDKDCS